MFFMVLLMSICTTKLRCLVMFVVTLILGLAGLTIFLLKFEFIEGDDKVIPKIVEEELQIIKNAEVNPDFR